MQAAIFDLDGTLADTLGAIRQSINQTMRAYGYPEHTTEEIRSYIGNGAKNLVLRSMPPDAAGDAERLERVFLTYQENYDRNHLTTDHCYDGITDTIAALHAAGTRLAVLSNKQDSHVQGLIQKLFPGGEFCLAMGQTDLPKKPDPTVPWMMAERMGVKPEQCAIVGDSEVDIRTAKRAGMRAIGVSWGYRDRQVLVDEGADDVVDSPAELLSLLLSDLLSQ